MGYRFRLHRKDLPGKPDIILAKHKTVIFVHGCFWHRHENCSRNRLPKSNVDFWREKFEKNVARDKRAIRELRDLGWRVEIVWECETFDEETLKARLEAIFRKTAVLLYETNESGEETPPMAAETDEGRIVYET
jgi:DNA mismatch endonuclease (patch repair protein)